jgi:hypothetical protein
MRFLAGYPHTLTAAAKRTKRTLVRESERVNLEEMGGRAITVAG